MAPDDGLIRGAKLFDGHRFLPPGCLLVREGRVAAVAERLTPPAGVLVLDARGGTVLPGLIDAHVHVAPGALQAALRAGVTTEVDMFADPRLVGSLRQQAASDPGAADLRSAGIGATAPGGHPTRLVERGLLPPFPTVAGPDEAEDFVAARVAEGSHLLKVVLEDGTTTGRPCPALSAGTVQALVPRRTHAVSSSWPTSSRRLTRSWPSARASTGWPTCSSTSRPHRSSSTPSRTATCS